MTGAAFEARGAYADRKPLGQQIVRVLTTTDHKLIGKLYLGTSFAWFLVGGLMAWRQLWHGRGRRPLHAARPTLDDPIIAFSPTFACQCPRALKVLITATVVGLLTGFLGVLFGLAVTAAVDRLQRWRIPRGVGAFIVVFGFLVNLFERGYTALAYAYAAVPLALSLFIPVYSRIAARIGTRLATTGTLVFFSLNVLGFWWAFTTRPF